MDVSEANPIEELFQRVLDASPHDRESLLGDERDAGVRAGVRRLLGAYLAAYEDAGTDEPLRCALLPPEHEEHPLRIGRFAIESVIADGGASVVYRARQDQPSRPVALKVVRPALASARAIEQFRIEAQLLARVAHPGIAVVHDVGRASAEFRDGREEPRVFIAMEFVEGEPLTLAAASLPLRARVSLMAEVCDIVHAAHQQGVLHRDLSPANILTVRGGRPKLVDFGSGILTADLCSPNSEAHLLFGTGPYLSPEHASGYPDLVDIRSDVYSLGVVLYEVLSGRAPAHVAGLPALEAARVIRSTDPSPLRQVAPSLPADLSLITAKATARQKADRYQSAAELAVDLRRFLQHQPISARPPSALHSLRLLAMRRPRLITAASIALLGIVLTAGVAVNQALRANRESRASALARDEAEAAAGFLERMLAAADPGELGRDVLVRDVLQKSAGEIDATFVGRPVAAARIHEAIGRTYLGLGDLPRAKDQLQRAYDLRCELRGKDDPATATCAMALASALGVMGEHEASADLYTKALEVFRESFGRSSPQAVDAEAGIASVEMSRQRFATALSLYNQMITGFRARPGPLRPAELHVLACCAEAYVWVGDYARAAALFAEATPGLASALGNDHRWTLSALNGRARAVLALGRSEEAVEIYRGVLDSRTRVLGPGHGDTLGAANNLADALLRSGRPAEAREIFERVLVSAPGVLGPTHRNTLKTRFNIAQALCAEGRRDQARVILADLLPVQRAALGPSHVDLIDSLSLLAWIDMADGCPADAEPRLAEAVALAESLLPADSPLICRFRTEHARALIRLGRAAAAEPVLREAVNTLLAAGPAERSYAAKALSLLSECYASLGRADQASQAADEARALE